MTATLFLQNIVVIISMSIIDFGLKFVKIRDLTYFLKFVKFRKICWAFLFTSIMAFFKNSQATTKCDAGKNCMVHI